MNAETEALRGTLKGIRMRMLALPGRFSLWSGKEFTYEPPYYRDTERKLRLRRLYQEGERIDDLGRVTIRTNGAIVDFSFHSFSGETAIDLNEARIYVRDCEELLSREFTEKVAADYTEKAVEFESLMAEEKALNERIMQIQKEGGAE